LECFQITVQAPENGRTAVVARAIDTNDDTVTQMGEEWERPVDELDGMLRAALPSESGRL
jgi:hypothetical protein